VLVLLPTPDATLVMTASGHVEIYGPHATVWRMPHPRLIIDVPADLVKILFGAVADFVDRMFGEAEHPFLGIFAEHATREGWLALLQEAEDAVTITDDQLQYRRWRQDLGAFDRQAERLCLRYAGQSPRRILTQIRFSNEFVANLPLSTYQPQGNFADQSHYIRTGKALTGFSPTDLKNLARHFYLSGTSFTRDDVIKTLDSLPGASW
jgi:hypothetical protein